MDQVVFEGRHFEVRHEHVEPEPGHQRIYEYVWRRDGARIIVMDGSKVLLTREYRHELAGHDWRIPGGRVEGNETPEESARRELAEETGYTARTWQLLWTTAPDSTVRYQRHFFLATGAEAGEASPDFGEKLTVHWLELSAACTLALDGEVHEEISALALLRIQSRLAGRAAQDVA